MSQHQVFLPVILSFVFISACQSSSYKTKPIHLEPEEISLKSDRDRFNALRKDIPEDIQKENDEFAAILAFFKTQEDPMKQPSDIREKWTSALRKRREAFDKWAKKARDGFTKEERQSRDQFTKDQGSQRQSFFGKKRNSDERKEFYDQLDGQRRDFYASQKERREDFEMQMKEHRQDFEAKNKELQGRFDLEFKDYQRTFDAWKKETELKKKQNHISETSGSQTPSSSTAPSSAPNYQVIPLKSGSGDQDN